MGRKGGRLGEGVQNSWPDCRPGPRPCIFLLSAVACSRSAHSKDFHLTTTLSPYGRQQPPAGSRPGMIPAPAGNCSAPLPTGSFPLPPGAWRVR